MSAHRPRFTWPLVTAILGTRRRDTAWLAVWSAGEALPALVFGRAVAGAIDAFRAGSGGIVTGLGWLGLLLAAAAVGAAASSRSYRRLAAIVEPLRDALVSTVVTAALGRAVRDDASPETGAVARITHQAEIVRDSFAGVVTTVRSSAFTAAAAVAGLLSLAPAVTVLVAGPVLASLALFAWLMRALARRQRDYVDSEESVAAAVSTATSSLRDVTACGAEDLVGHDLGGLVTAQARAGRALARVGACRTLVLAVGCWAPVLLVIAAAPGLLRRGVTPGALIGALAYLTGGLQVALNTLVQGAGSSGVRMSVTLERILAGAARDSGTSSGELALRLRPAAAAAARHAAGRRFRPAARRPAPGPLPPGQAAPGQAAPGQAAAGQAAAGRPPGAPGRGRAVPPSPGGSSLRLRGLTFAYGPRAEPVIRDLNLDVPFGDHIAVVGPSGIGKSTLAALMAGLLRPARGQVLLGGVDLGALGLPALTSRRVLIPQEAYVFSGCLGDNLAYLRPHVRAADLDRAVGAVGAAGLAARLGGYDAMLRPGSLSAGERQLIALARAYLAPARLVILDEATCHLDPALEARAEQAFSSRPGTLIVIAHRPASALRARRILVLDGSGAETGDHESLLVSSPLYADLIGHWQAAAGPAEPTPALAAPDETREPARSGP
jgi:ATP-binding cassette subfamily C protein